MVLSFNSKVAQGERGSFAGVRPDMEAESTRAFFEHISGIVRVLQTKVAVTPVPMEDLHITIQPPTRDFSKGNLDKMIGFQPMDVTVGSGLKALYGAFGKKFYISVPVETTEELADVWKAMGDVKAPAGDSYTRHITIATAPLQEVSDQLFDGNLVLPKTPDWKNPAEMKEYFAAGKALSDDIGQRLQYGDSGIKTETAPPLQVTTAKLEEFDAKNLDSGIPFADDQNRPNFLETVHTRMGWLDGLKKVASAATHVNAATDVARAIYFPTQETIGIAVKSVVMTGLMDFGKTYAALGLAAAGAAHSAYQGEFLQAASMAGVAAYSLAAATVKTTTPLAYYAATAGLDVLAAASAGQNVYSLHEQIKHGSLSGDLPPEHHDNIAAG
jgi:hypothetical protein